jgi:hypothetical protein
MASRPASGSPIKPVSRSAGSARRRLRKVTTNVGQTITRRSGQPQQPAQVLPVRCDACRHVRHNECRGPASCSCSQCFGTQIEREYFRLCFTEATGHELRTIMKRYMSVTRPEGGSTRAPGRQGRQARELSALWSADEIQALAHEEVVLEALQERPLLRAAQASPDERGSCHCQRHRAREGDLLHQGQRLARCPRHGALSVLKRPSAPHCA